MFSCDIVGRWYTHLSIVRSILLYALTHDFKFWEARSNQKIVQGIRHTHTIIIETCIFDSFEWQLKENFSVFFFYANIYFIILKYNKCLCPRSPLFSWWCYVRKIDRLILPYSYGPWRSFHVCPLKYQALYLLNHWLVVVCSNRIHSIWELKS